MYVFLWNRFHNGDTVWWLDDAASFAPGDLLHCDGDILLCLWDSITLWIKDSVGTYWGRASAIELLQTAFVSERVLLCMHWFVQQWFTTYYHTVPLWLWWGDDRWWEFSSHAKRRAKDLSQQLLIFPDLWTMRSLTTAEQRSAPWHRVAHSRMSVLQKKKLYWDIVFWKVTHLYATPSQIFFDWACLDWVTVHRQHQRRYKNAQDPRYDAVAVAHYLAALYEVPYLTTGQAVIP
jgi:hypothetical protein